MLYCFIRRPQPPSKPDPQGTMVIAIIKRIIQEKPKTNYKYIELLHSSPTTSVESSTKTDNLLKSEKAAQTRAGHRRPARCLPETLCQVPGDPPPARCLAQGRRLLRAEQSQEPPSKAGQSRDGLPSTQSDKLTSRSKIMNARLT